VEFQLIYDLTFVADTKGNLVINADMNDDNSYPNLFTSIGYTLDGTKYTPLIGNYSGSGSASIPLQIGHTYTIHEGLYFIDGVADGSNNVVSHLTWELTALPAIKMDDVQFSGDTSTVDFDYETTANPGPFTVGLYYSPTPTYDPNTAYPVTDPTTGQAATQVVTPPGPNSSKTPGVFNFSQPLVGDPTAPCIVAVADPDQQLQGVDESQNSAAVELPTVKVNLGNPGDFRRYTLMDQVPYQITVASPSGAQGSSYSLQVQSDSTLYNWTTVGSADQGSVTERLAGDLNVRAAVTINRVTIYSDPITEEVQFPTFEQIMDDPVVQIKTTAAWVDTINYTESSFGNQVREEGFYILLDTSTGQYAFSPTQYGAEVSQDQRATLTLGAPPSDVIASNYQSAIYTVADFHTHPPITFSSRPVGPSNDLDIIGNFSEDLPGLVYDYANQPPAQPNSGGIYVPYFAPATIYLSGPDRRSTPR